MAQNFLGLPIRSNTLAAKAMGAGLFMLFLVGLVFMANTLQEVEADSKESGVMVVPQIPRNKHKQKAAIIPLAVPADVPYDEEVDTCIDDKKYVKQCQKWAETCEVPSQCKSKDSDCCGQCEQNPEWMLDHCCNTCLQRNNQTEGCSKLRITGHPEISGVYNRAGSFSERWYYSSVPPDLYVYFMDKFVNWHVSADLFSEQTIAYAKDNTLQSPECIHEWKVWNADDGKFLREKGIEVICDSPTDCADIGQRPKKDKHKKSPLEDEFKKFKRGHRKQQDSGNKKQADLMDRPLPAVISKKAKKNSDKKSEETSDKKSPRDSHEPVDFPVAGCDVRIIEQVARMNSIFLSLMGETIEIEELTVLLERSVRNNDNIFGVTFAFEPGSYFSEEKVACDRLQTPDGGLFALAGYRRSRSAEIRVKDLSCSLNYLMEDFDDGFSTEFYSTTKQLFHDRKLTAENQRGYWTLEPYQSKHGRKDVLTFSVPFVDKDGNFAGVSSIDVLANTEKELRR